MASWTVIGSGCCFLARYEKDILQANLSDTAIRVKVVDKDAFGADDFMGQIEITWGELLSAEGTLFPAQWRTLLPKSNLSATSGGSDDNETKQPIPKSADNTAATRLVGKNLLELLS